MSERTSLDRFSALSAARADSRRAEMDARQDAAQARNRERRLRLSILDADVLLANPGQETP